MTEKTHSEKLIEAFDASGLSYGSFVSHKDIERWADLPPVTFASIQELSSQHEFKELIESRQFGLLNAVDALKKYLLHKKQMMLVNVRGEGYRIANPGEQTDIAVSKGMKQIQKGLATAAEGVEHVNKTLLSSEERAYNESVGARLKGLNIMLGRKRDLLKIT